VTRVFRTPTALPPLLGVLAALLGFVLVSVALAYSSSSQMELAKTFTNWLDHPAIQYKSRPTADRVAQLNRRIDLGFVRLRSEGASGYLRSVLKELDIPIESQVMVFAKDSFQQARIDLHNPRVIFFNDSTAVGWVRGGVIEIAAQDPRQGVIFYMLGGKGAGRLGFQRQDGCLSCHYNYPTTGVPGMRVASTGRFTVDHRVPLEKRWGGWYVTGTSGSIRHLGNAAIAKLFESPLPTNTSNWRSLESQFDTTGYISPYSDIVALMVFEHQMHLMNLLSRIGWESRIAEWHAARHEFKGVSDRPYPLEKAAAEVVDYLLFVDEATFEGDIRGSSGFTEQFVARGPRDRRGRSLREFDLRTRLMRYRCSYMVYSPVFDGLPVSAKSAIYRRLWEVLSGVADDPRYKRLSLGERQTIIEILRDTKTDLPDYFQLVKR
jgi:hypothetical protein